MDQTILKTTHGTRNHAENKAPVRPAKPRRPKPAPTDRIGELVAAHRPGWSLAQPFYNDAGIFRRDFERIFLRQWLFAGHASRVRHAGDYFLFTIANESIIVIRGKDGQIHALFNVCRHRGSRVCLEPAGTKQTLVCPYHAWTYAADGRLLSAPAMPEGFNAAEFGLRPCGVRVVEGLIFVHLGPEPPDREPVFRDWERYFQPHGLAGAKIATSMTWPVHANWKLVIENFDECYHCGPTHPEYCSVMAHALPDTHAVPRDVEAFAQLKNHWETAARQRGHLAGRAEHGGDIYASCTRIPIRQGFQTQSQDGQPVAPLLGDFGEYDGGCTAAELYPVNYCLAFPDHAVIPRFTPLGPTLTEVEMIWLVRDDAVEGRDYHLDRLTWLWRVTTDQDKKIVDDNQAGVNSLAYRPGPYSKTERGLIRFTTWYLQQLAPAQGPVAGQSNLTRGASGHPAAS